MKKYLYIIVLSLSFQSFSQQHIFENITDENGLSHNEVNSILCDSYGFMWFGTKNGLDKYDGYKFTSYKSKIEDSLSLSYNAIRCIYEDSNGDIWIGTLGNGLNKYNRKKNIFERYLCNTNDSTSLSSNNVYSIFEDSKKNLWIGTYGGGLQLLNRSTNTFTTYRKKMLNSIAGNSIRAIAEDSQGNLWIACDGDGLTKFNYINKTFCNYYHNPSNKNSLVSNAVLSIYIENDTSIFIGTWAGGISRYNPLSEKWYTIQHNSKCLNSLSNNDVFSIYKDLNGNFWFSTRNGVDLYNPGKNQFIHYKSIEFDKNSIPNNFVTYITGDKTGGVWIATVNGVCKTNIVGCSFDLIKKQANTTNTLLSQDIQSLCVDKDNNIIIGTLKGVQVFNPRKYSFQTIQLNHSLLPEEVVVKSIATDKKNIWIGTDGYGLVQYQIQSRQITVYKKNNSFISNNSIHSMWYDSIQNKLYLGTFGGGLNIFNINTKKFENFNIYNNEMENVINDIAPFSKKEILLSSANKGVFVYNTETNEISQFNSFENLKINSFETIDIYISKDKKVWIATNFGLGLINYKTKEITFYNISDNTKQYIFNGIVEDCNKNLWLSSNNGIFYFNTTTKKIESNYIKGGIQGLQFSQRAVCSIDSNTFVFGGINGINIFNSQQIIPNTYEANLVITNFKILNSEWYLFQNSNVDSTLINLKEIFIPYNKNSFAIEFSYLHFASSNSNKYAYMLEGYDDDWQYVSSDSRTAIYKNIPGGTYVFKVRAANSDGIWKSKNLSITITVNKPFWQTYMFYICLIISFIILFRIYIIHREKLLKEKIKASNMIKEHNIVLENINEELNAKNEEIRTQDEILKNINEKLIEKNKLITSSIEYSKYIQSTLLFENQNFKKIFPESFILYKPKDIVSGDFYWCTEIIDNNNKSIIISCIDCIGHGVPGAFITIIAKLILDKVILAEQVYNPSEILSNLHSNLITMFKCKNDISLDMSLIKIVPFQKTIIYSTANQKFSVYLPNHGLKTYKGDNCSIGDEFISPNYNYKEFTIEYSSHTKIYLYSDGFADQFGGVKNQKYMDSKFNLLLESISDFPITSQKKILLDTFNTWKCEEKQTDDVLILGFELE